MRALLVAAVILALSAVFGGAVAGAGAGSLHSRLADTLRIDGIVPSTSTAMVVVAAERQGRLRAQRRRLARARLEREALGHLRGARRARPRVPLPDRGARRGPPGRAHVGGAARPQGLRRPDAHDGRSEAPRRDPLAPGDPARDGRDRRRRLRLRRQAHRARLAALVRRHRVAAALGARRRPRGAEQPSRRRSGPGRRGRLRPAAARARDQSPVARSPGPPGPERFRSPRSTRSRCRRSSSSWTTGATTSRPRWC